MGLAAEARRFNLSLISIMNTRRAQSARLVRFPGSIAHAHRRALASQRPWTSCCDTSRCDNRKNEESALVPDKPRAPFAL